MSLVVRHLARCGYAQALALQESLVARKLAGETDDYLLLLEHDPVYTLGRGADAGDLMGADERLGVPVFRVGRGGGVTFHGPGQLVAYPILTLTKAARDVRRYLRALEDVLLATCESFGVMGSRREGQTGVWVQDGKIASIGVGIRHWTTLHGIALNVSTDLSFFSAIVPCRMPEVRMTSLACELGREVPMREVESVFARLFCRAFDVDVGAPATVWAG